MEIGTERKEGRKIHGSGFSVEDNRATLAILIRKRGIKRYRQLK